MCMYKQRTHLFLYSNGFATVDRRAKKHLLLELSAVSDEDLLGGLARLRSVLLDLLDDLVGLSGHAAEHAVLAI